MKLEEATESLKELKKRIDTKYEKVIEIVLQQLEIIKKENEELKKITQTYESYKISSQEDANSAIIIADKHYFHNGYFVEQYVSKDKIRRKIKILKEEKEDCNDSVLSSKLLRCIYVLKELLDES